MAGWSRRRLGLTGNNGNQKAESMLHEALTNGSVVLLLGSMVIGAVATPKAVESIKPFVSDIFMGMLCLLLLEMGLEAARRSEDFRRVGLVLAAFGMIMPLAGAVWPVKP